MDQRTAHIAEDVKDIVQTRTAISETLSQIEHRLASSIEDAKQTASEFVDHAKATVEDAVTSTKRVMDPVYQAAHHPWLLVGGAVLLGFTVARLAANRTSVYPYTPPGTMGVPVMQEENEPAEVRSGVYPYFPAKHSNGNGSARNDREVASQTNEAMGMIKQQLMSTAGTLVSAWLKHLIPVVARKLGVTIDPLENHHRSESRANNQTDQTRPDASQPLTN